MQYHSIWEDTIFSFTETEIRYRIDLVDDEGENKTIFEGNAKKTPDADFIYISIDSICQNYLNSECNNSIMEEEYEDGFRLPSAIRRFELLTYNPSLDDWEIVETYEFLNDWSYRNTYHSTQVLLSEPINGHYATGMPLIWTRRYLSSGAAVQVDRTGEYYNVLTCGDYSLIYQNALGGIDNFLIEGNVIKTSNQTHSTFLKPRTPKNRETNVYMNEISESWVCTTGWLADRESAILSENLLMSPQVWLFDIKNHKTIPVEITDTAIKEKTYQNEGKKLVNYTINIKSATYKYRKN